MYNAIRDKNVEALRASVATCRAIQQIRFDIFEDDNEILRFSDDTIITTTHLNPIQLGVYY